MTIANNPPGKGHPPKKPAEGPPKEPKPITLAEFATQLGQAGIDASRACEDYALKRLQAASDEKDGVLVPHMRKIQIYGRVLEIPEIVLLAQQRLDVQELEFEFEATITMGSKSPHISNHNGVLKNGMKMKSRILFRATDSLEIIELLRERINRDTAEALSLKYRETEIEGD